MHMNDLQNKAIPLPLSSIDLTLYLTISLPSSAHVLGNVPTYANSSFLTQCSSYSISVYHDKEYGSKLKVGMWDELKMESCTWCIRAAHSNHNRLILSVHRKISKLFCCKSDFQISSNLSLWHNSKTINCIQTRTATLLLIFLFYM